MEKIKSFVESDRGKDILTVLIVILVGFGAFGLGRLSKQSASAGLKIEYPEQLPGQAVNTETQTANAVSATTSTNNPAPKSSSGNFFASNRGTKYYSLGCSGGKTIKQENRVYFNTASEAEAAGYELSSSCK